ncbi:Germin-like protein subfamily 1 member [Quillaja saponaria]|uniref:Germin-like protein subfamily 1 member n=1 Tax=Quillaja saponaria TaxID=32244 RepID=A0AAD7PZ14_QUISA|nr:Germin-like protein subfamily 1 member [Quillaja saponaria]
MASRLCLFGLLMLSVSLVLASDQSPLQDFCVADTKGQVSLNGFTCKDPKLAEANDFFFSGLHPAGNTSNAVGSRVTPVTATQLPGLNTLGISIVRIDYAAGGINPPHTHPRATEILTVIDGSLEKNVAYGNTIAIAALSSQNPGVITIANAVFGSKPDIAGDILVKAFQLDKNVVTYLQSKF